MQKLNQIIYADIKANSSGGGGYDEDIPPPLPPPPDDLPGYDPYDEDGGHEDDDYPIVTDEYLDGKSGRPIYSSVLVALLRWNFDMHNENIFPTAIVNGKVVCEQHSESHIVSYSIGKTSGSATIKMTLRSSGSDCKWNGEASCKYEVNVRGALCDKSGTCGGGATFRVSIDASGKVSIS